MSPKLEREFYLQPTLTVASALIGKEFVLERGATLLSGRIVETEAYIGESDPACHARFGRTKRNAIMYGEGGYTYVYFVYGMYDMLNFVTERKGFPAAVLIRALEPLEGIEVMRQRRRTDDIHKLTSGPGKLCRAFELVAADTGIDLTGGECYVRDTGYCSTEVGASSRIGINDGRDLHWRFYEVGSKFVSRP
jgi:DNA-3-methyladenine glycosylase